MIKLKTKPTEQPRNKYLTRQLLADPHAGVPHMVRLKKARAIDLRDNLQVSSIGKGYVVTRAFDESKKH